MPPTRRQSALSFLALIGGASLIGPTWLWAKGAPPPEDDDDDDAPPNVFISPHGQPFRARAGAPYPVVDWFKQADKNADGKIDKAEFLADAEAFFKTLDRNGDGVLSHYEVLLYEHNIAPEVLGGTVRVGAAGGGRLWLALIDTPGPVDPGGGSTEEDAPVVKEHLDVAGQGAVPYSFFEEPEPLLAADLNVDGIIRKDNFLKVAGDHFASLDVDDVGYLTLKKLPRTPMQKLVEHSQHGRRKT